MIPSFSVICIDDIYNENSKFPVSCQKSFLCDNIWSRHMKMKEMWEQTCIYSKKKPLTQDHIWHIPETC